MDQIGIGVSECPGWVYRIENNRPIYDRIMEQIKKKNGEKRIK